jgi:hypothetical protein
MTQFFNIHYNGDTPFKVEINENLVDIYFNHGSTPFLKRNAKTIFIGESPMNKMTIFSGGHGPDFLGNSILLELGDNQYEFIGKNIFSFTSLAKIIHFVSPVGNNDVPYPYAIDIDGNIYLLIEEVVLLKHRISAEEEEDLYSYYYKKCVIGDFYIDENNFRFTYCTNPEKNYERLIPTLGKQMFLMDINDNKSVLTKEEYITHVNQFGHLRSFEAIRDVNVYF